MSAMAPRAQLTDLVKGRKEELGLSLRALEAACIDPATGAQAKYSWLHRLTTGKPTEAPTYEVLVALSLGLKVPLKVVQEAAAEQYMGIKPTDEGIWSQDRSARIVVARMSELSAAEREQLAEMVELFTRGKLPAAPGDDRQ